MSRNAPAALAAPAPPFELVAIDLDGTLVDTIADLHAAVAGMQDALGLARASEDDTRARVGNGIERLVHRTLAGATGLAGAPDPDADPGTFERGLAAFRVAYDAANGARATLYPGVADELDRLRAAGVPVVVVTNKAGRYSRPLLDALGVSDRVAGHVAGDDVAAKKPAPDALLAAARLVGARPARSLMVGDSVSDVRAARGGGFRGRVHELRVQPRGAGAGADGDGRAGRGDRLVRGAGGGDGAAGCGGAEALIEVEVGPTPASAFARRHGGPRRGPGPAASTRSGMAQGRASFLASVAPASC